MVFLGLIFNLCRDGYYTITGKDKKVSDLSSFQTHKNVKQNIIYEFENLKRCLKADSKVAQESMKRMIYYVNYNLSLWNMLDDGHLEHIIKWSRAGKKRK